MDTVIRWFFVVGFAGVAFMTQVPIEEAKSNIQTWLNAVGFDPKWAMIDYIDSIIFAISIVFVIVLLLLIFWRKLFGQHRSETPLEIVFKEREETYFQQLLTTIDIGQGKKMQFIQQLYRVCLTNKGTKSIYNVQVKIYSIEPPSDKIYAFPLPLRFMHDKKEQDRHKQIAAGQDEFVDVVSYVKPPRDKISLEHIVDGMNKEIESRDFIINIRVTGNEIIAIDKRFRIYVQDNELFMTALKTESGFRVLS